MPIYNSGKILNLLSSKVDIEDKSYLSSDFFVISDFSGDFGAGKNSITINNSPSDIQIEAVDSSGAALYYEIAVNKDFVAQSSATSTNSILISFHVYYPQNKTGIGRLTLIGTFKGKLVRYSTVISINNKILNSSKVRYYTPPTIEVVPLLSFITSISANEQNPKILSGSFYSRAIYPQSGFSITEQSYDKANCNYQVFLTNTLLTSSVESFYVNLHPYKISIAGINNPIQITNNPTASYLIKNVINNTTLQLQDPFVFTNPTNNKLLVSDITSGSFDITYSDYVYNSKFFTTASYITESFINGKTRYKQYSLAEITYRNLDTFSGTTFRHKVYKRSLNVASDYTLVLDENIGPVEIFKNYIVPIKSYQNLGKFYSQDFVNRFWFTSSNSIALYQDSNYYLNGLLISGSSISDGYIISKINTSTDHRDAAYIPYNSTEYLYQSGSSYDCNYLKLLANNAYVISFNLNILNKNIADAAEVAIYLTGSYQNNIKEKNYNTTYGVLLADITINEKTTGKNFISPVQFRFTPLNDIYGSLVIVPRNLNKCIVSNISIQLDSTYGFSLNSYTTRTIFNVDQPNELFDIKSELYDNNSNLVYSNLRTIKNFDPSGSSSPISSQANSSAVFSTLNLTALPVLGSGKVPLYISASIVGT
jgi:hypothetical protein